MSKNIYKKGNVYLTDVDGFDPIDTYMPFGTYISCEDIEISSDDLPFGCTHQECIKMLKTVEITKKVIVKVGC